MKEKRSGQTKSTPKNPNHGVATKRHLAAAPVRGAEPSTCLVTSRAFRLRVAVSWGQLPDARASIKLLSQPFVRLRFSPAVSFWGKMVSGQCRHRTSLHPGKGECQQKENLSRVVGK